MSLTHAKNWILQHKYLLGILFIFFLLRVINLTLLPVFNDEAIYLDWGWREIHTKGFLFYSLYDAKQPLLMWIFGIAESISTDPLVAGRLVSVGCGLFSLLGLFKLGKALWNRQAGLLAALLYAISPLFIFYDRQALMESAIAAIGIWSCWTLLKLSTKPYTQYALLLGILLSVGFFIKSSSLLFILASLIVLGLIFLKSKQKDQIFLAIVATYIVAFFLTTPLFMQKLFWDTLSTNSRFSLTPAEYLQFPVTVWWHNILVFLGTAFFFLTPFVFLTSLTGIQRLIHKPTPKEFFVLLWLFLIISGQILVTRQSSVRYIISFLPLLLLFSSHFLLELPNKYKLLSILAVAVIPLVFSFWQVFAPASYILSLAHITPLSPTEYVLGQTSGYGINSIRQFIASKTSHPILVAVADNTGNPESAMEIYYESNPNATTLYLDQKLLGDAVDKFDCINPGRPLYFVSREDQQAGLNKFLVKVKTIHNPYGLNTWGIYTLRPNCKGVTANLQIEK